jgi:hypothetical protein
MHLMLTLKMKYLTTGEFDRNHTGHPSVLAFLIVFNRICDWDHVYFVSILLLGVYLLSLFYVRFFIFYFISRGFAPWHRSHNDNSRKRFSLPTTT